MGNDAKAIQDAESSGPTDLTASLSSGVVLSDVKDGVAKTDVGAAKTDEPGLEQNEPKWSDPKRNDLRRNCNFGEDGDVPDLQDEDHDMDRSVEEEIAWQHYLDRLAEDQAMKDIADQALEEAKARAEAQVPDFIKAEKKGKGQAATWFKGSKTGMAFKTGEKGLAYYKEQQATVIKLAPEIFPMQSCTPMKIIINELINATTKEEKEPAPKTSPATVKQRLDARSTKVDGPEDLSWADDGSMSMMNKDHREEGLWAFDTCNPNAWPGPKSTWKRPRQTLWLCRKRRSRKEKQKMQSKLPGTPVGGLRLEHVLSLRLKASQRAWLYAGGPTLG